MRDRRKAIPFHFHLSALFRYLFLPILNEACIPTAPIEITVTTTTTVATTTTYPCPAGWTYLATTAHCYIVFPATQLDFYAGEALCLSVGGNLATVNNIDVIDLLLGLAPATTSFPLTMPPYIWTNNQLLIGGYDVGASNDNVFAWIDGTAWAAQALGIYDNYMAVNPTGENCLVLTTISFAIARGVIDDVPCTDLFQAVACEMP